MAYFRHPGPGLRAKIIRSFKSLGKSTESEDPAFVYKPLDLSKQQIRLVRYVKYSTALDEIQDGHRRDSKLDQQTSDEPVLLMRNFEIDDCPEYTALSYTWGNEPTAFQICIHTIEERAPTSHRQRTRSWNDSTVSSHHGQNLRRGIFEVRRNLRDFLKVMRDEYLGTYFWIDQLCIDQINEQEKNHQVQFMGEIFGKASFVVAWLGSVEGSEDYVALSHINKYSWSKKVSRSAPENFRQSFLAFLRRRYWSRLWIIQEIVLANRLTFRCGPFSFTWSNLWIFNEHWFQMWLSSMKGPAVIPALNRWWWSFYVPLHLQRSDEIKDKSFYGVLTCIHERAPQQRLPSDGPAGLQLVPLFKPEEFFWQCEKSQDLLYSIMGLLPPAERMRVDYSKPFEELQKEAWLLIVSQTISNKCILLPRSKRVNEITVNECHKVKGMAEELIIALRIPYTVKKNLMVWPSDYQKEFEDMWKTGFDKVGWTDSDLQSRASQTLIWPEKARKRLSNGTYELKNMLDD